MYVSLSKIVHIVGIPGSYGFQKKHTQKQPCNNKRGHRSTGTMLTINAKNQFKYPKN